MGVNFKKYGSDYAFFWLTAFQWSAFYLPIISQLGSTLLNHDGGTGTLQTALSSLPACFLLGFTTGTLGGHSGGKTSVSSFFIPPVVNGNHRFILQLLLALPAPGLLLPLPATNFWVVHSR